MQKKTSGGGMRTVREETGHVVLQSPAGGRGQGKRRGESLFFRNRRERTKKKRKFGKKKGGRGFPNEKDPTMNMKE